MGVPLVVGLTISIVVFVVPEISGLFSCDAV